MISTGSSIGLGLDRRLERAFTVAGRDFFAGRDLDRVATFVVFPMPREALVMDLAVLDGFAFAGAEVLERVFGFGADFVRARGLEADFAPVRGLEADFAPVRGADFALLRGLVADFPLPPPACLLFAETAADFVLDRPSRFFVFEFIDLRVLNLVLPESNPRSPPC